MSLSLESLNILWEVSAPKGRCGILEFSQIKEDITETETRNHALSFILTLPQMQLESFFLQLIPFISAKGHNIDVAKALHMLALII